MVIASAVVAMVAVLVMLAVAKNRRRIRSAAVAYMAPSPSTPAARHGAAEPDEGSLWRRELLEAIEAAAALPFDTVAPSEQDSDPTDTPAPAEQTNRRPETGLGPQEEPAALTEPVEVVIHTGPLESIADTGPLERIVIPEATTPFDAFTSDESTPEPTYRGRRRRSGHAAGDEGAAPDTSDGVQGPVSER
ncbi:hypothetical protein ABT294_48820 [Nonomuraea sp. NPDC000554]|uniref:hypothetical protein n=1 Tax=Nonomuraea sp. NPDC000554 TaxID=3154259 RepID=UPI003334A4D8